MDQLTHPEDLPGNLEMIQRLLRGEIGAETLEKRFLRKNGSYLWVRLTASVIRDPQGRVLSTTSVVEDITEQKQAQARVERDSLLLKGIARILSEALSDRDEAHLGSMCLEVAEEVTESPRGFLSELEGEMLRDLVVSEAGSDSSELGPGAVGSPEMDLELQDLYGRVVTEGRTVVSNRPPPEGETDRGAAGAPGSTAFLGVPLVRDGRTVGLLAVAGRERGYTEEQREMLEALAPVVVEAYGRKRAEEGLRANARRQRLLAEENQRLYREQLNIAQSLQSMLTHVPEELARLRLGHLYHSATEGAFVGGDFYDAFRVGEDRVGVLIGDVSGHGVEAARVALLVRDVVHAFLHQSLEPEHVLAETNALLLEKSLPGFVSLFLGILDVSSGAMRYATAGHPYAVVKRGAGALETFTNGSVPLAVLAESSWKTGTIRLQPEDVLFLYTDGLVEMRRGEEFLGEEGLLAIMREHDAPVDRLPGIVLEQALRFSERRLSDDVAILALSLAGVSDGKCEGRSGELRPSSRRFLPTRRKHR